MLVTDCTGSFSSPRRRCHRTSCSTGPELRFCDDPSIQVRSERQCCFSHTSTQRCGGTCGACIDLAFQTHMFCRELSDSSAALSLPGASHEQIEPAFPAWATSARATVTQ